MTRRMIYTVAVLALVTLVGSVAYRLSPVQDFVMKRGTLLVFGGSADPFDGLQAVVCGSASPLGTNPDRAQACIAIVTPEHFFLVDVGARAPMRINQAQLPLNRLNGVMFTHFHSDHIAVSYTHLTLPTSR